MLEIRRLSGIFTMFFILSIMCSQNIRAEEHFSNKLLADMSQQLFDTYKMNVVEGEIMLADLCPTKPLVVEKNSHGAINHIGIKLFNRDFIQHYPSALYRFVERYFLELLLLPSEQEILTKMRMERVKISSEMYSIKSTQKGLLDIIAAFVTNPSICILCNNNRYVVSCRVNNRLLVEVNLPVRYELISGFTKLEAENSVYMSILSHKKREYVPFGEEELFFYNDSISCGNEDYYLTEEIVSTSYYVKDKDVMRPVFSKSMLGESVCNLFNSLYDWGVTTEICQNLYGGKKNCFTESLVKVLDFYSSQGCRLYTGINKYDKSKIEGVLIAVNMELGYQHLLNFSFHKDLFDEPEKHEVKMKVYSYIPIHNVSSMFDEKRTKK